MGDENIFTVEKIVDSRILKGKKQYLIKWEGFENEENTWESAKDILCKELIDEFERSKKQPSKPKKITKKKIDLDISNEWHEELSYVESVYRDEKSQSLMCDLVFQNGKKLSVEISKAHLKCPIRLLEYYEKNINFIDEN